jgi:hypothetical protein
MINDIINLIRRKGKNLIATCIFVLISCLFANKLLEYYECSLWLRLLLFYLIFCVIDRFCFKDKECDEGVIFIK